MPYEQNHISHLTQPHPPFPTPALQFGDPIKVGDWKNRKPSRVQVRKTQFLAAAPHSTQDSRHGGVELADGIDAVKHAFKFTSLSYRDQPGLILDSDVNDNDWEDRTDPITFATTVQLRIRSWPRLFQVHDDKMRKRLDETLVASFTPSENAQTLVVDVALVTTVAGHISLNLQYWDNPYHGHSSYLTPPRPSPDEVQNCFVANWPRRRSLFGMQLN